MKRIFYIKGEKEYDAGQLVLSLRVGEKYIGYSISHTTNDELIQLGWFTVDELQEKHIEELYHAYPELKNSYQKIVIGFDSPVAMLVPDKFYKKELSANFLQVMEGTDVKGTILTESLYKWQVHVLFTISDHVKEILLRHFPGALAHHAYVIGINQLQHQQLAIEGNLFIEFRPSDFSVLATRNQSIILFQTFPYTNPADVVYYLLRICKEYALDQNTVQLQLSGLIEKDSMLYVELQWYFIHVAFRNAGWQVHDHTGEAYPSHFFTFFNDLSLCES